MPDLTPSDHDSRQFIVAAARSLFDRQLTHGSTGNISVRRGDRVLVTPTGSSLGTVEPDELSTIDLNGVHVDGPKPSKEAFLHAATLRARPTSTADAVEELRARPPSSSCSSTATPPDRSPPNRFTSSRIRADPALDLAPGGPVPCRCQAAKTGSWMPLRTV